MTSPGPPTAIVTSLNRVYQKLKGCQRLLANPTPASILGCAAGMGEVRMELEKCLPAIQATPGAMRAEVREQLSLVVVEFRHSTALLHNAAELYDGWKKVLASYLGGYTRTGAPARILCQRRVVLKV